MGKYPSRAAIATETNGLSSQVADALTDIGDHLRALLSAFNIDRRNATSNPFVDMPRRTLALARTLSWRRRVDTPRLQFDAIAAPDLRDTPEDVAPETSPWVNFIEFSTTAMQQALRLEDLHASATNRVDAADYALQRLRLELSAVAPELVASLSLPPRLAEQNVSTYATSAPSLPVPALPDIAA